MNWLNAIPETDRAEIRKNLFASPEFFEAVRVCIFSFVPGDFKNDAGESESWFTRNADFVINRAFERHGFKQPHSATSVTHNIMAENTERDRHAARMLALSKLITEATELASFLRSQNKPALRLELAIAAAEREFKP